MNKQFFILALLMSVAAFASDSEAPVADFSNIEPKAHINSEIQQDSNATVVDELEGVIEFKTDAATAHKLDACMYNEDSIDCVAAMLELLKNKTYMGIVISKKTVDLDETPLVGFVSN